MNAQLEDVVQLGSWRIHEDVLVIMLVAVGLLGFSVWLIHRVNCGVLQDESGGTMQRRRKSDQIPVLPVVGLVCMGVGILMVMGEQRMPCPQLATLWTSIPYIVGGGLVIFGGTILMPERTVMFLDAIVRVLRRGNGKR